MNLSRPLMLALGLIAAAALIGLWAYFNLPADVKIAVHFAANGAANGYAGKAFGLAIMPAVGALVVLVVAAAPMVSPNSKGLAASSQAYGVLLVGLALVFLTTEAALVAHAFDPTFDVLRVTFLAVGALLLMIGNMLGKIRHNYLFGIRTPWTLADPRVWDKTHRFTGRLMFIGGLGLMAVSALLADDRWLVAAVVICAAGPALAGAVYSRMIATASDRAG
jgi:uncharacterized membrane protein